MSTIYTLGYAASGALESLETLMADPLMTLVDIRYRPASRFRPLFRKPALEQRFTNRYHHVPELGNLNYKDRSLPIVLNDPVSGLPLVLFWLDRGYSVCLLCACSDVQICHRLLVTTLLQERWLGAVVHC